jgi:hypothetical protein
MSDVAYGNWKKSYDYLQDVWIHRDVISSIDKVAIYVYACWLTDIVDFRLRLTQFYFYQIPTAFSKLKIMSDIAHGKWKDYSQVLQIRIW